jgi:hypothetical protein
MLAQNMQLSAYSPEFPMTSIRFAVFLVALTSCAPPRAVDGDTASHDATVMLPGERTVDASTADAKMLMGYQGWFGCPSDGSALSQWMHWSPNTPPTADTVKFDAWPDTSDLAVDERCETDFHLPSGASAPLFSAYDPETVARHTRWMAEHDIDGVFLQRFTSELHSPPHKAFRDQVARNIMDGAEANGRVFAIMFDISGQDPATLVETVKSDWMYLVDSLGLTDSDRYLHHRGRPLVAVWGLGFNDRPGTPEEALALTEWFHSGAEERYQAAFLGGVPTHWRTLSGDAHADPAWTAYYHSLDILSPWAVGRYATTAEADAFRTHNIEPDLTQTRRLGIDYMPVIFPGFSWTHLTGGTADFNAIPRQGGRFYWRQVYNAVGAGSTMIYTAMFDEVDEATAMFKIAPTTAHSPTETAFLTLDVDGESLPADWYLSLGGAATKMLRGEIGLTATIPIIATEPETPATGDDATIVSHTLPAELAPDEATTAWVTVRNTGSTTWTRDDGYKLGAVDDADPLYARPRVWLTSSSAVAPGQEISFEIDMVAPAERGTVFTDWQMVHEGVAWFGDIAAEAVTVAATPSDTSDETPPTDTEPSTAHAQMVTRAYRGILGRDPDPSGQAFYEARLAAGGTSTELSEALWISTEFADHRGHLSSEALATELYRGILDREPDASGLAATSDAIDAGRGSARAAAMLSSEEALRAE